MPGVDDRLEQALRGAARPPEHDPDVVAAAVAHKRRRRRARRQAASGLAVATVVVAALTATIVVVRDGAGPPDDVQVATNETTPPPTAAPPSQSVQPPADPEAAEAEILAAAPRSYEVGQVTFVAPDGAVATVTDDAGASYEGVRFEHTATDGWTMTPTSTCRLATAGAAACADVPPEVLVSPGKVRLGPEAYGGTRAATEPIPLTPDPGYLPGPLLTGAGQVVTAAYDRTGATYDEFPSRVVATDPESGAVAVRASLEGTVLALGDGEGALWAVTRDRSIDDDQVEHRVKRIGAGAGAPETMPIPPGHVPAGDIVVRGGRVWVPVHDGVLAYDAATGELIQTIRLPAQARRGVAVLGDAVYLTHDRTLTRIDADGTTGDPIETGAAEVLIDLVATDDAAWALTSGGGLVRIDPESATIEGHSALPPGMDRAELGTTGGEVWAKGVADLAPAPDATTPSVAVEPVAVLLDGTGIATTLVLAGAVDVDLAVTTPGELVFTSGGDLFRVALPR